MEGATNWRRCRVCLEAALRFRSCTEQYKLFRMRKFREAIARTLLHVAQMATHRAQDPTQQWVKLAVDCVQLRSEALPTLNPSLHGRDSRKAVHNHRALPPEVRRLSTAHPREGSLGSANRERLDEGKPRARLDRGNLARLLHSHVDDADCVAGAQLLPKCGTFSTQLSSRRCQE